MDIMKDLGVIKELKEQESSRSLLPKRRSTQALLKDQEPLVKDNSF